MISGLPKDLPAAKIPVGRFPSFGFSLALQLLHGLLLEFIGSDNQRGRNHDHHKKVDERKGPSIGALPAVQEAHCREENTNADEGAGLNQTQKSRTCPLTEGVAH